MLTVSRFISPAAFSEPNEASSRPSASSLPPRACRGLDSAAWWKSFMICSATSGSTFRSRTISAAMSSASESVNWAMTLAAFSGLICMRTTAARWVPVRVTFG